MKTQEEAWGSCRLCGQRTKRIREDSYSCDGCGKNIDDLRNSVNEEKRDYLEVKVFHRSDAVEDVQYCSWKCLSRGIRKLKTDYFIVLPYLSFDGNLPGQTPKDFFNLLRTK